jgi:uridine kinase
VHAPRGRSAPHAPPPLTPPCRPAQACAKGVKIGKILIQREGDTGPCRIIYEKARTHPTCAPAPPPRTPALRSRARPQVPLDISRRYVLLLDPILASGNSAIAAIDLLLGKGVAEDHIIFLTLIAAPQGIRAVCERFPRLVVVTSEIDASLSANHVVLPGIGEFGDRYFGTDCVQGAIRPGERASQGAEGGEGRAPAGGEEHAAAGGGGGGGSAATR